MGHYLSEMKSYEEWEDERKQKERLLKVRTDKIQKLIDKKGLARFLAEMTTSSYDGKINVW